MSRLKYLILVAALVCPILAASNGREAVDSWNQTYILIFGPNREGSYLLSEQQLMHSMMYLHNAAIGLDSINDNDRNKVEFWYDKVYRFDPADNSVENCNTMYLQNIADVYEQHNLGNNPNLQQIYITFRKNIMRFCETQYSSMLTEFASRAPKDKLVNLLDIYSKGKVTPNVDLINVLIGPVLKLIGASSRASSAEVLSAWTEGPCGKIVSTVKRPDMKPYFDFIEMCKYDSRDLRWHCSKALKDWIDVVEMCRDIDILMPYIIENINTKRLNDVNIWYKVFEQIFGMNPVSPMPMRELLLSVMYLYANVDSSTLIDEGHRRVVKFWYEASVNFDIEDCNIEHVNRVTPGNARRIYDRNINFRYLYNTLRRNLIEFCDGNLADLPTKFNIDVSNSQLAFLKPSVSGPQSQDTASSSQSIADEDIAESLASSLIEKVEGGATGAVIMDAWKQGPCGIILDTLVELHMQKYSNFIQMSLLENRHYLKYCSRTNQIWIRVVDICAKLNDWIAIHIQHSSSASSLREAVRAVAASAPVEVVQLSDS